MAKETPYLSREIGSTRQAYNVAGVRGTPYSATSAEPPAVLAKQVTSLPDVRLMDPAVVSQSFQQLQQVKSYYKFADVLSVDLDPAPGSSTPQDTLIGVRDMNGPPAWPGQLDQLASRLHARVRRRGLIGQHGSAGRRPGLHRE